MSADFLPLAVGNRWIYDVVNQDGQKIGQVDFSVSEHTIVKGRSFYVLSHFPFDVHSGDEIHLVRYDKTEKQFVRVLDDQEDALFLADASSTEVIEADQTGLPTKFVLHSGPIDLTFQRGVGITEADIRSANGLQIAKIASARVGEGVGPGAISGTRNPNVERAPSAAQQAGIPLPKTPEQKARDGVQNVGSITDDNPLLILDAGEVAEGHKLVLSIRNTSDKLLPFSFSSGQSYDFAIIDPTSGQEIWRWSRHMFFVTQVRRSEAIPPQGQWKYEVVWNHRDNDLNPVPPGAYKVVAFVTTDPEIESESITIEVK
jgi:Intracellular proteinase inhibitor